MAKAKKSESRIAELRGKNAEQLNVELVELRKEEFNLRMQRATGQLENSARFSQIRKDCARILTLLNEQKRNEQAQEAKA
ncbi:MAG: 50S ribosomal protein L29 [Arenicella sp.]